MTLVFAHEANDQTAEQLGPVCEWLRSHGLAPNRIHRIEIHVIDVPLIRVFEFDEDEHGKLRCLLGHLNHHSCPDGCDPAHRDPYDVLLKTNPPAVLYPEEIL